MNRILLFVITGMTFAAPVFAQESNPLVGTWKLVSWESIIENEPQQHLFGLTKRLPDHYGTGAIDDRDHRRESQGWNGRC